MASPPFASESPIPRRVSTVSLNSAYSAADDTTTRYGPFSLPSSYHPPPPSTSIAKSSIPRSSSRPSSVRSTSKSRGRHHPHSKQIPPPLPSSSTATFSSFTLAQPACPPEQSTSSLSNPKKLHPTRTASRLPKQTTPSASGSVSKAISVLNARDGHDERSMVSKRVRAKSVDARAMGGARSKSRDATGAESREPGRVRTRLAEVNNKDDGQQRRRDNSLGDMTNSVGRIASRRVSEVDLATITTPRRRTPGGSPVRPPRPASNWSSSPEKRKKSADIRQVLALKSAMTAEDGNGDLEGAYSSMQDLLASSGFMDTRVVTPIAANRRPHLRQASSTTISSPRSNTSSPTDSPVSNKPALRQKPSLLSLAISSIWPSSSRPESSNPTPEATVVQPPWLMAEGDQQESEDDSDSTIQFSRRTRAREWVQHVARETSCSPTTIVSRSYVYPSRYAAYSSSSSSTLISANYFSTNNTNSVTSPASTNISSFTSSPLLPTHSVPNLSKFVDETQQEEDEEVIEFLSPWDKTPQPSRYLRHIVSSPDLQTPSNLNVTFQSLGIAPPASPSIGTEPPPIQYGEEGSEADSPDRRHTRSSTRMGWTKSLMSIDFSEVAQVARTTLRERASVGVFGWRASKMLGEVDVKIERKEKGKEKSVEEKSVPSMLRKKSRLMRPGAPLKPVLTTSSQEIWG